MLQRLRTRLYAAEQGSPDLIAIVRIVLLVLVICLTSVIALRQFEAPEALGTDAGPGEFSAERAMRHVEAISDVPRPQGSPGATKARDYIIRELRALGLEPTIQDTIVVRSEEGAPFAQAGRIQNVAVRIQGTASTGAILLGAHYDSGPVAPGAGDCGSCVATAIETARALLDGEPLRNDVIILFPDAEETLLGGSYIFMKEHPWARDVRASLNLEAQGRRGASMFYFSGTDDGELESIVLDAAKKPFANSFMPILIRSFVGGSDGDNYTEEGMPGVGFAFFYDGQYYHTMRDNAANLSLDSLQHHGDYTLPVVQELGRMDLNQLGDSPGKVFFNVLPGIVVEYPAVVVLPLAILITVAFFALGAFAYGRGQITVKGSALGAALALLGTLLAVLLTTVAWWLIRLLNSDYHPFMVNVTYQDQTYLWAFRFFTLALVAGILIVAARRTAVRNLLGGALFWWWLLMLATAIAAPQSSHLFMWPLVFALVAAGWMTIRPADTDRPWSRWGAACLVAIPVVLAVMPTVHLIAVISGRAEALTGLPLVGIPVLISALAFFLATPLVVALRSPGVSLLPFAALALSLGMIAWANLTSGFDAESPKPNMVVYELNADSGEAAWFTTNDSLLGRGRRGQIDAWTKQFFGGDREETSVPPWLGLTVSQGNPGYRSPAPAIDLSPPTVEVIESIPQGAGRTLRLRVASSRGALNATLELRGDVIGASLEGRAAQIEVLENRGKPLRIVFYALPPEGFEMDVTLGDREALEVEVMDSSIGLPVMPGFDIQARPVDMVPAVFDLTDTTNVRKTFILRE